MINDTRWGSVYKMLLKYVALCKATTQFRECSFKFATRQLVSNFERVDDNKPYDHGTIIELNNIVLRRLIIMYTLKVRY